MKNSIAKSSIITMVSKFLELLILYMVQALLTRTLSVTEFGMYSKWLVALNYTILFTSLGLNNSYLYSVSLKKINYKEGIIINYSLYIIIIIITFFIVPFIFNNIIETNFFMISVFFSVLFSTLLIIPLSKENFFIYNIFSILKNVIIFLSLLVVFLNLVESTALNTIKAYSLALIIVFFISLIYFKNSIRSEKINFRKIRLKIDYISYGVKSLSLNFLGQTLYIFDVFIVAAFLDNIAVAYYVVAGSVVKISWFLSDTIGTVLFPRFIKNGSKENDDSSLKLIYLINQISFIANVIFVVLFILIGKLALKLIYSAEYQQAFNSILILLLGSQGLVIYKLYSRYLAAINQWKNLYVALSLAIITNVSLNYLFIPLYGIEGAALASLIAYWICGISIILLAKQNIVKLFGFAELYYLIINEYKKYVKNSLK